MKILINKSNLADTRTCDWSSVTHDQLLKASNQHISDVKKGVEFFIERLVWIAHHHDYTRIINIDEFYADFQTGFKNQEWYENHQKVERHHLLNPKYVQEDVNLLDILEMITDGIMAGLARSGEYRKEEISDELLRKAFYNTVELLLHNVEVYK